MRAGVKVALLSTPVSAITLQVQGYFPTGDALKGLGTHHTSIEPALLSSARITDRLALESQVGVWHPIKGSAGIPTASAEKYTGDVIFYGIGPSFEVYSGDSFSFAPVVELVGWRVRAGFQASGADAGGTNIVNLKFGARASFNSGSSLYFGYGRALTDAVWYSDIVRFEYRFRF